MKIKQLKHMAYFILIKYIIMRPVDLSHEEIIVAKICGNKPWREMTKTWLPRTVVERGMPVIPEIKLKYSLSRY